MGKLELTSSQQEIVDVWAECKGNKTEIAKRIGRSRSTVRSRIKQIINKGYVFTSPDFVELSASKQIFCPDTPDGKKFEFNENFGELVIWSVGDSVRTVEDAVAKAEVDLNIWYVDDTNIKSWPTSMKLKDEDGIERPHQEWNWGVHVKLKRKAPRPIQKTVAGLLEDWRDNPVKHPVVKRSDNDGPELYMLELALFDSHFGKLCWGEESGEDYNTNIAADIYINAVEDLLENICNYNVDKILLPIGNDFFHVDNWFHTTTRGTDQDVDDRFQKIFRIGCETLRQTISMCREIADVECIWVPGNHDLQTSWYLVETLAAYHHDDEHVSFDNGSASRKYRRYGCNLIGFTHGNEEKHQSLPLIMARETRDSGWAETTCQEIHIGHFHKKKETQFLSLDEFNGVRVRVIPSLTATDKWHFMKGYVKNNRVAEAYLWHFDKGYAAHFSVNARDSA